ncbi:MAG: hypothetical protein EPN72_08250 [Nevskiaceae bacterium]|nr:MAG: hypothetical protein EPN63_04355 [Nevskiaceae bacterium]TBR73137.1 MAG: hypothetical protein EPN72_08250 [Nevskiaceae bacterium]
MAALSLVTDLVSEHDTLSQLLWRHQEALVAHNWARAARLIASYRQRLLHCIYLEEESFLSYCVENGISGRWSNSCISDHRRLDRMLRDVMTDLAVARRRGVTNQAVVMLIDKEKTMKTLFDRHLQREDEALVTAFGSTVPDELRDRYERAHGRMESRKPGRAG